MRTAVRRLVLFGGPVVLAVGLGFGPVLASDDEPEPTVLVHDAGVARSLVDVVAASDAVVLAEVVDVGDGRAVTDPVEPAVGIRTQMAELQVVDVLVGDAPGSVILEEEATLLDGTPVSVDGSAPVEPGDRGVFFLVAGGSEAAPHWALVGPQGRYLVRGDALEPAGTDALSVRLAQRGGPALVDEVRSVVRTGG